MEKRIIDARGLACPLPVVNAKKAVGELAGGGVLTVLADNEIAMQNLLKFAAQKGLEATGKKKADKEFEVVISVPQAQDFEPASSSKMEDGAPVQEANAACCLDSRRKGVVVAFGSNEMGNGEEALGRALVKAFIFALTKQDMLPETILCYNSGAFLTCAGSESLEDFRTLEAEGVQIMTCGTCLDFYGLKEKLEVGTVTNMYDIVETLERASLVIRP